MVSKGYCGSHSVIKERKNADQRRVVRQVSKKLSQSEIDALINSMLSDESPAPSDGSADLGMEAGAEAHAPEMVTATEMAGPDMQEPVDLGLITQPEVDAVLRAAGKESLISSRPITPSPGLAPLTPAAPAQSVAAFTPPAPRPFPFPSPDTPAGQILLDLELTLTAELVRTRMQLNQLLRLQPGSVIELNRLAGEPVDLVVGGHQLMKAKVVTVGENYGVQVTESRVHRPVAS